MSEQEPAPDPAAAAETPDGATTIPDVIASVFRSFPEFAQRHFLSSHPPARWAMIWLIGMDAVAGTLEVEYVVHGEYLVNNWFHAWLRIMLGGILAGAIRYWAAGSLFHLFVLVSRGRGLARTSRYIFLYAMVPVAVVNMAIKVTQMLVYKNEYFAGVTQPLLDTVLAGILGGTYILSARLCYTGAVRLQNADRRRALVVMITVVVTVIVMSALFVANGEL